MKLDNKDSKFKCCICEKELKNKAEVEKHQKEYYWHTIISPIEKCNRCSGFFCTY